MHPRGPVERQKRQDFGRVGPDGVNNISYSVTTYHLKHYHAPPHTHTHLRGRTSPETSSPHEVSGDALAMVKKQPEVMLRFSEALVGRPLEALHRRARVTLAVRSAEPFLVEQP